MMITHRARTGLATVARSLLIVSAGLLLSSPDASAVERPFLSQTSGEQAGPSVNPGPGTLHTHHLSHQGRERQYLVYVPSTVSRGSTWPVVLNFHGGAANAAHQMKVSRMNESAERHGFLVVYPEGTAKERRLLTALNRMLTFNAGRCCGYAEKEQVDDVGFVQVMLDDLAKRYPVDQKRVYATGFSNGGMLTYRLGVEMTNQLAAIAVVSADLSVDGPPPARPLPVLHFHGLKDDNARWEGGKGGNQLQPNPHRSIPETLDMWKRWNRCQPNPVAVEKGTDFIKERYEPAAGQPGAPVVLYKLPEGGHQWPGGKEAASRERHHLGTLITSVSASEIMWEFFSHYRLP